MFKKRTWTAETTASTTELLKWCRLLDCKLCHPLHKVLVLVQDQPPSQPRDSCIGCPLPVLLHSTHRRQPSTRSHHSRHCSSTFDSQKMQLGSLRYHSSTPRPYLQRCPYHVLPAARASRLSPPDASILPPDFIGPSMQQDWRSHEQVSFDYLPNQDFTTWPICLGTSNEATELEALGDSA